MAGSVTVNAWRIGSLIGHSSGASGFIAFEDAAQ